MTSRAELSNIAIELFLKQGYDETTIDDIARAAGIGRRTFFRYFPSKNEVAWGNFDEHLAGMRASLETIPEDVPLSEALTTALHEAGFIMTETAPDYVVVGETRNYSFEAITKAIRLIGGGARFIATNPDATGPSPEGPLPATDGADEA